MIPVFNHNHVIPPYIGDPTRKGDLSPYSCTTLELCKRFGFSQERRKILFGLLSFREKMNYLGITEGFQWLDGSFIEDVELTDKRPPNDLDLVTFYGGLSIKQQEEFLNTFVEFSDPELSRVNYKLDHYAVDYSYTPELTIESTRYWIQIFSHNRFGVWKGILRLELNTPEIDKESLEYLNQIQ